MEEVWLGVISTGARRRRIDIAVPTSSLDCNREYTYTHVVGVGGLEWVVDLEEAREDVAHKSVWILREVRGLGRTEFATAR